MVFPLHSTIFSSSSLLLPWDKHSLFLAITKQQIIDDWEKSAEAFIGLFSFTRALRVEHSIACITTSSLDLISQHFSITHPHCKCTGVVFNSYWMGLETPPLHPSYCLILLFLIKELAFALTVALCVSHSR